jgi:hypothetical protein
MAEYDFHFTAEVMDGIFAEVISARGAWDTLGERLDNIEQGAGGDTYTKAEVDTMLAEKVDKVTGKDLSTNDFTNADKAQITTNKNGIAAVANSGAKNLYKPTNPSTSNMEVQFTVNNDGTVSVSGTASPSASVFRTGNWTCAKSGTYVVSGCPEGGSWAPNPNKYRIRTAVNNTWSGDDTGTGILLNLTEGDVIEIQINTAIGLDATGLVFKPMIRDASIEDSTYVPYAPTNRELYEMILALQSGS